MQHTIDAGTVAAMICCFDPAVLPANFGQDGWVVDALRLLHDQQRLWLCETGSDGNFRVKLFVDEPVSGPFTPYLTDPITIERFSIPSGILWICGGEYVHPTPGNRALGEPVQVTPGAYRFTAWLVDETHWEEIEAILPERDRRLTRILNALGGLLLIAALGCTVLLLVAERKGPPAVAAVALWTLLAVGRWAGRLQKPAAEKHDQESASLAIELHRLA